MRNNDLTQHSDNELVLWVENDEYLNSSWRKTLKTGNISYIQDSLEACGFSYTKAQWETLVNEFEEELQAEEDRLQEQAEEDNAAYFINN